MVERQRLEMERDLSTARRSLLRCHETAERGAYYGIEDTLHVINALTQATLDAVMRGKEVVSLPASVRAYLLASLRDDHGPAAPEALPESEVDR